MLTIFGKPHRNGGFCDGVSRRDFLTIGGSLLGGLSLSVGILVDEATVAVENIHTHMERESNLAMAVWRGTWETTVPRLLAMLCILAVFLPSAFSRAPLDTTALPL